MIELRQVSKRFGATVALDAVDLSVPSGQITAVLGPNGSGKSTLLRLIAGLQRPSAGQVQVMGLSGAALKARVAYVPDAGGLYPWQSLNVAIPFFSALFADFDAARAVQLGEAMAVPFDAPFRSLSKGQQARLRLVLAFARRASLYLLDEPFEGLDVYSREQIGRLILNEFRPGEAAIVITTHAVDEIEGLVDYAVYLRGGRVAYVGGADDLRAQTGQSLHGLAREVATP